jgi:hypothetical protein
VSAYALTKAFKAAVYLVWAGVLFHARIDGTLVASLYSFAWIWH